MLVMLLFSADSDISFSLTLDHFDAFLFAQPF